jgi:hypothetical protein
MFPRLRLKLKPNLISLAGGMAGIPVTQPHARATPLAPAEWRAKMAQAAAVNAAVEAGRQDKVGLKERVRQEWVGQGVRVSVLVASCGSGSHVSCAPALPVCSVRHVRRSSLRARAGWLGLPGCAARAEGETLTLTPALRAPSLPAHTHSTPARPCLPASTPVS